MDEIIPLFSKSLFIQTLKIDSQTIVQKLNNLNLSAPREDKFSSDRATIYNVLQLEPFNDLNNIIEKQINNLLQKKLHYNNSFVISTSWITKTKPNQKSEIHNHDNCFFSGILYLQTELNCGKIEFLNMDNKRFDLQRKEYNIFNSNSWTIEPKNNMLILFPSELYHRVLKNNSNITRISLAFNIMPKGILGSDDSSCTI
ncbi:hypothetical protein CMO86_09780 [Candidatus Woesearchaeota archaeon]|nr:hypothetical protein [Candidatus Woesearchaeota archaeon]|tara:strand:+ start:475 stop:1074 length:600 start_codon:yes stop_codon:yes gene_type:complete